MEIVLNNKSTNNTILMFTTRGLCYNSAAFFTSRLSEAFEQMGYDTLICELDMAQEHFHNKDKSEDEENSSCDMIFTSDDEIKLEGFAGRSFKAVIDFNSRLPRMVMEDGSYYLDNIDAPFYNYILDNPLYHHSTLSCTLRDYNVVLVDTNHCAYVRKYYPHINNVIFSVLSTDRLITAESYNKKIKDIIFPGTYRDPKEYLNMIMSGDYLGANYKLRYNLKARYSIMDIMKRMLDVMLADAGLTMQQALLDVLDNDVDCAMLLQSGYTFNELMNYTYPVEMYLRNLQRKNIADAFVKNGIHITVMGDWWDRYEQSDSCYLTWENPVTFSVSALKIAQYSIVLDSSPFFKGGIHDRIFAGMANQTAVVTDYSQYKADSKLSGCVSMYRQEDYNNCVDISHDLLINDTKRSELVDKALDIFENNYTWKHTAERIAQTFSVDV
jgi:hypothetical protein